MKPRIAVLALVASLPFLVAPAVAAPPSHESHSPKFTRARMMNAMENGARTFVEMTIAPKGGGRYVVKDCKFAKVSRCKVTTKSGRERCTMTGYVQDDEYGTDEALFWLRRVSCRPR